MSFALLLAPPDPLAAGGSPVGFNVGTPPGQPGGIGLKGIDVGIRGKVQEILFPAPG